MGVGPDLSKFRIGISTITNYNWNYDEPRITEGSRLKTIGIMGIGSPKMMKYGVKNIGMLTQMVVF